jgi:surface polysaccharide O-acyltransferase-like enzyme
LQIPGGWLRTLNDGLGVVRMPIFALIAGALYASSRLRGASLLVDKFQRLVIPMLTVGTAFALLQYGMPGTNQPVKDLRLLHIVPVAHYWFLESLFLIFCLMACLDGAHALKKSGTWLLVFLSSVLVYLMHPGFIWFGVLGAFYLLPYFLLGLALVRFQWDASPNSAAWGAVLLMGGVVLVGAEMWFGDFSQRFSPRMLTAGLLLSSGLWLRPLRHPWLAWLGDYSYAIFLFHVFFTAPTRMALQALDLHSVPLHIACGLLLGILGPIATHHELVRTPTLGLWLMGVRHAPNQAQPTVHLAGSA